MVDGLKILQTYLHSLSILELILILLMYVVYIIICGVYTNILRVNTIVAKETKSFLTFSFFVFNSFIFLLLSAIGDYLFALFISFNREQFIFLNSSLLIMCLLGIYNFYFLKIKQKDIQ